MRNVQMKIWRHLLVSEKLQLQEPLGKTEGKTGDTKTAINALRFEVKNLTKQLSTMTDLKEKLEHETATIQYSVEEEIQYLKEENAKLVEKTTNADETLKSMKSKIRTLEAETANAAADCEMDKNITSSYLPFLIDCCEKALLEQRQQTEVIDSLKNRNIEEYNEELVSKLRKELEHLRNTNEMLNEELLKAKHHDADIEDVLKPKNDLTANSQICEDLQAKLEKQERENTDLLNEMRELNEALKQAKHQEMIAEMKKTSNALSKFEADLQSKETILKEKETKISKLGEDNKSALQEVNCLQNSLRENEFKMKQVTEDVT